jgi:hypothetical protein
MNTVSSNEDRSDLSIAFICIITAGIVAGTLDALAAIFILAKGHAGMMFKFISSAVYGQGAFSRGGDMIYQGIAFHYLIAFLFTVFYFLLYYMVPVVRRYIAVNTIIYGIFIWVVMNMLILPLTNANLPSWTPVSVAETLIIIILCVSLPKVNSDQFSN